MRNHHRHIDEPAITELQPTNKIAGLTAGFLLASWTALAQVSGKVLGIMWYLLILQANRVALRWNSKTHLSRRAEHVHHITRVSTDLQMLSHAIDAYTKAAVEGTKPSGAIVKHQASRRLVEERTKRPQARLMLSMCKRVWNKCHQLNYNGW